MGIVKMGIVKMDIVKFISISFIFYFTTPVWAETSPETPSEKVKPGYISDDLFIYMHSGPGSNYRILGSINSGVEIALTGKSSNGYTEIIDIKDRKTWVEDKYVSSTPGLRNVIAELNSKLADYSEEEASITAQLSEADLKIQTLEGQNKNLNKTIERLNTDLTYTTSQLKDQDMNIKKEWFFNGAIVLCIGLLLGIFVPKLGGKRKGSMDNWK